MSYAIETRGLIKRYPTNSMLREAGGRGPHARGSVSSFNALIEAVRGPSGPFVEALRGVDLSIRKGEIFGILGPNGAGKTTLIKILCTLVIHDEGEVRVNGHDPLRERGEVLRSLQAVLPESRGFNWRLTGRQNLEFYALLYGLNDRKSAERIDYLLEFTGLKIRADDGIQRYSTGMLRRLLLCRSLLRDTPIIVFDEPTTGLDPSSAAEFRKMIIERLARQEGKTILLSTHNLEEAQILCDRVAILDRGRIIAMDTPDNVRHLVIEDRFMKITLSGNTSSLADQQLTESFETIKGVHVSSINSDQVRGTINLNLRIAKDIDLAAILKTLGGCGLKILSVNVEEPTLEDAFNEITRNHKDHPIGRLEGER